MSVVSSYRGTGNDKDTNPRRGYPGVLANRAGSLLAVMLLLVFADGFPCSGTSLQFRNSPADG